MSYDDWDYQQEAQEAYEMELIETALKDISAEASKSYLGRNGDAVDARVHACLQEADALLKGGFPGPALSLVATGIELMIRFLLLRPLIQGAFLSDEWAGVLARRVATGRSAEDRELVPAVLRQWGMDITAIRSPSQVAVWEFLVTRLWPGRDTFIHRYDSISHEVASTALECAYAFRAQVVGTVATKLGFTLGTTGCWCKIRGDETTPTGGTRRWAEDFKPEDPFIQSPGRTG